MVLLCSFPQTSLAQYIWNPNNNNGQTNWSDRNVWDASEPANNASGTFTFSSDVNKLNNFNDFTGITMTSLVFSSGAGAYNLYGNAVTLNGNVTNNSSTNQTIHFGVTISGQRTIQTATNNITFNGAIGGSGGITKTGQGTLTLTGNNSYSGNLDVQGGVVDLQTGPAAGGIAALSVSSGATLLVSTSNQVNNTAPVTLSGGTIRRASGVSEVFGSLSLTSASFLDYGTGTAGTLTFGSYTPSSLLTVNNFFQGNTLTFQSNLTDSISNTNLFIFDNNISYSWDSGSSTFTVTAIPEPNTAIVVGIILIFIIALTIRNL